MAQLLVIKVPRGKPLVDKPIEFPPLYNLHLDMLENKLKLKKTVPKQLIQKRVMIPPAAVPPQPKPTTKEKFVPEQKKKETKEKPTSKSDTAKPTPPKSVSSDDEDDDLLGALGDDSDDDEDDGEVDDDEVDGEADKPADAAAKPQEPEPEEEEDPDAGLTPEEKEAKEKEEYLWRFKILKKGNPKKKDIPEFNEHDDLTAIKLAYERTVKEVHLDRNVSSYRTYLVGGFVALEFVAKNYMDIDLEGFAPQQIQMMDQYDSLLVELGERSYNRWGMNLPVEVKLIGMILIQAGLFYLCKCVSDKKGEGMANLIRGMTGAPMAGAAKPATQAGEGSKTSTTDDGEVKEKPAPAKKMRGPSVTASDIKKNFKNSAPQKKVDSDDEEDDD
jgi:hypothetical protein